MEPNCKAHGKSPFLEVSYIDFARHERVVLCSSLFRERDSRLVAITNDVLELYLSGLRVNQALTRVVLPKGISRSICCQSVPRLPKATIFPGRSS